MLALMALIGGRDKLGLAPQLRLDRPFYDWDTYAISVMPNVQTLLAVATRNSQCSYEDSALLMVVFLSYMVIGSAASQIAIRGAYHDMENARSEQHSSDRPDAVLLAAREALSELHEVYDLDIAWEAYKRIYRRVRKQLSIEADLSSLQQRLDALYREALTRFEQHAWTAMRRDSRRLLIVTVILLAATFILLFASLHLFSSS